MSSYWEPPGPVTLAANQDVRNVLGTIPSVIKTVQYGTITIAAAASGTATITAVVVAKAVVIWLGNSVSATNAGEFMTRLTLTNTTTVTAVRDVNSAVACTVSFVVVEFN